MSERRGGRRVTLADVAASAGVSRATASRALADDPRISPATRRGVQDAAATLNYVPNAAARSLRVRRTRTLGLLLPDLADPVHGQVAAGFELEAAAHGYSVIFVAGANDPDRERQALALFVEHAADGIALVSSVLDPREARDRAGQDRPVVVVQPDHAGAEGNRDRLSPGLIRTDDAAGVAAAMRHLLSQGCRSIAYLGVAGRPSNALRRDAARRALARRVAARLTVVELDADAWRDPASVGERVPSPLPDGIVCYDDKLALALMDGLRAFGVHIPRDVLVVGFDDIPFATLANPRLTTVSAPTGLMGRLAARALADAIAGHPLADAQTLPAMLQVRESTQRGAGARAGVPSSEHAGVV